MHLKPLSKAMAQTFALAILSQNSFAQTAVEQIIVSANKTAQPLEQVTANVTIITAEDIESKHYTTITQVLNTVAGISFASNGGVGKQTSIYLRGFDSKRTLVLIDGIRYNDPTSISGAPFEHLMLNDIERIEIIKGPQSGIWGADASAGVINIITKSATKGFSGNFNLESGSYNTQKMRSTLKYGAEKFDAVISLSSLDSDGFTAAATPFEDIDQFEADGYQNTTLNAKLGINLSSKDRLAISHNHIQARSELDAPGAPDNTINYGDNLHKLSKVEFTHKEDDLDFSISQQRNLVDWEYNSSFGTSEFDGEVIETAAQLNWRYATSQQLTSGLSKTDYEHQNSINGDYSSKSAFISHSHSIGKTVFNESLRHDNYDKFNDKTTFKLGLKHPINQDLSLAANYATGYNIPTLSQLFASFGNPNLQPETTKGWDISAQYQSISVTYFNNTITDMIDWDGGYQNLSGITRINGIETEWKHSFKHIDLALNHTRLWTKAPDGEELERRPKDQIGLDATWYASSQWEINLNGQYIGERSQGNATDYYAVFNGVVNYQANHQTKIYLKVDNLTNKYYQVVDGYATAERSAYLGINYQF